MIAEHAPPSEFLDLADRAPSLVWLTDARHRSVWYSRHWLDYTGRSMEEELGDGWLAGVHPDDREPCLAARADAFAARRDFAFEYRLRRADGSYGWVADAGSPRFGADGEFAGYIGCCRDVSGHRQAEQALRESLQHTQAIVDHAVDAIIIIDGRGTVHAFNRAACTLFGHAADEIIGRNVSLLMPEPHRSLHDAYIERYQASGEPHIIGIGREVQGQRKNGTVFPMELAVSEIVRDGQPMYVGLARDITERKQIECIKSELVSTVSHELRTPLTAISGALGLLAGGVLGELPPQARQMIDIAYKNSLRLAHLINDLLDFEKLAAGKLRLELEVQPLMPLIEQTLEATRSFAEQHQVRFELVRRADDVRVRVDGLRLQQILTNFLSNAARFSPPGAPIEISVHHGESAIRVEVADRGPGVPEAFRDRLFQKFSRADTQETWQGSGLGLAISKELAERMNGRVGLGSGTGEGARFYLELPALEGGGPDAANPSSCGVPFA